MSNLLEELGIELDCNLDVAVGNLEEFGALGGFRPEDNPDWYTIRQRDGEFVMGEEDFPKAVDEEIKRALCHINSMSARIAIADGGEGVKLNDDGKTLREEVAEEVDVDADELASYLQDGGANERRGKLDEVVEAVEDSDTFERPDSYDKIEWVPSATRHHLTKQVVARYGL
ncbi:hypothetical protein [Natronorubrum daqingense]|uniref:Uncharacterized protein n=1 Tax=Natronorubrum daqingense TaxID=588898 RepID=A0A1N7FT48_9EURY|nr:hypothetical protein [Natronorubrum daqingense]APX97399.1 hypothetical protein BB347_12680 [Natronorubrum daqingense]SIS03415.1 hypothetical protein SAMN05421809_3475 [Natronorubrum daqingense]